MLSFSLSLFLSLTILLYISCYRSLQELPGLQALASLLNQLTFFRSFLIGISPFFSKTAVMTSSQSNFSVDLLSSSFTSTPFSFSISQKIITEIEQRQIMQHHKQWSLSFHQQGVHFLTRCSIFLKCFNHLLISCLIAILHVKHRT